MSQSHTHAPLAICTPTSVNRSFLQRIATALRIARSRRTLARLDADALADIGLTPEQARIEANRSIWDAPSHWAG